MTKRDYCETLGIDRDADEATIKRAYRSLATKLAQINRLRSTTHDHATFAWAMVLVHRCLLPATSVREPGRSYLNGGLATVFSNRSLHVRNAGAEATLLLKRAQPAGAEALSTKVRRLKSECPKGPMTAMS